MLSHDLKEENHQINGNLVADLQNLEFQQLLKSNNKAFSSEILSHKELSDPNKIDNFLSQNIQSKSEIPLKLQNRQVNLSELLEQEEDEEEDEKLEEEADFSGNAILIGGIPIDNIYENTEWIKPFQCCLCNHVAIQPVRCPLCSSLFCKICMIHKTLSFDNKNCPNCLILNKENIKDENQLEQIVQQDFNTQNFLHEISVDCLHKMNGCSEVVVYADYEEHIQECSKRPQICLYCGEGFICDQGESHKLNCIERSTSSCKYLFATKLIILLEFKIESLGNKSSSLSSLSDLNSQISSMNSLKGKSNKKKQIKQKINFLVDGDSHKEIRSWSSLQNIPLTAQMKVQSIGGQKSSSLNSIQSFQNEDFQSTDQTNGTTSQNQKIKTNFSMISLNQQGKSSNIKCKLVEINDTNPSKDLKNIEEKKYYYILRESLQDENHSKSIAPDLELCEQAKQQINEMNQSSNQSINSEIAFKKDDSVTINSKNKRNKILIIIILILFSGIYYYQESKYQVVDSDPALKRILVELVSSISEYSKFVDIYDPTSIICLQQLKGMEQQIQNILSTQNHKQLIYSQEFTELSLSLMLQLIKNQKQQLELQSNSSFGINQQIFDQQGKEIAEIEKRSKVSKRQSNNEEKLNLVDSRIDAIYENCQLQENNTKCGDLFLKGEAAN